MTLPQKSRTRYQSITVDPKTGAPQSGSINYTISADRVVRGAVRNVDGSFKMNAVLTFSPGQATLVIDGSHSYRLDASGNVTQ
jgi:hypothetical protein